MVRACLLSTLPGFMSIYLLSQQMLLLSLDQFSIRYHRHIIISNNIDLKNTTDDAFAPYLTQLPEPYAFVQDHTNSNVRFALGYSAVAIAAAIFYVDRQLGWESTQAPWVLPAVITYFVLNSLLTYWVWAVEAGEVFRGKRKTGEKVYLCPLLSVAASAGLCNEYEWHG